MRGKSRTYYALEFMPGFDLQHPTFPYTVTVHRFGTLGERAAKLINERVRTPGTKQHWVKSNSTNRFVNLAWEKAIDNGADGLKWPVTLTFTEATNLMNKKFFYAREQLYRSPDNKITTPFCNIHRFQSIHDRDSKIIQGGGSPTWAAVGSTSHLVIRAKAKAQETDVTWPVKILRKLSKD